jgi:hypothetical protein
MNPSQRPTRFGVVSTATAAQTDGLTFLHNMISGHYPAPPFADTSDIWIIEADHGRVLFEAVPAEKFLNPLGTIHGVGLRRSSIAPWVAPYIRCSSLDTGLRPSI